MVSSTFAAFLLLLLGHSFAWNLEDINPIAKTRYGSIRGRKEPIPPNVASDVRMTSFIGVPYAQPPTGINRFADPRELDKWNDVLDATNRRVMCPQVDQRFKIDSTQPILESEDCLYLNIHVLGKGNMVNNPVLVYFPGGEFKYGGKDFYRLDSLPVQLSSQSGLVLVTVNYRLGPLGFLSADTNEIHGNYGLRDMIAALRWVQSEISEFHGDRNTVIIGGHDAGGIAVSMLMLITNNERLFSGAFSSGGTVFTPWAFERSPEVITRTLTRSVNCYSRGMLKCLRQKPFTDIISAANLHKLQFRPTIDRNLSLALFHDEPEILYRNRHFTKVPYVAGITQREGALDYYLHYEKVSSMGSIREKIKFLMKDHVRRYANLDLLSALVEFQYFGEQETRNSRSYPPYPTRRNRVLDVDDKLIELLGDYLYNLPTEKALIYHSRAGARARFYVYMYDTDRSKPTFGLLQRDLTTPVSRDRFETTHMDDIFTMFKTAYASLPTVPETELLPSIITELRDSGSANRWANYMESNRNYMHITPYGRPTSLTNFRSDRDLAFWNDLFTKLEEMTVVIPPYFPEDEFISYQAATWSLLTITIILMVLCGILVMIICTKRRKDKRSLKLIRQRNEEFTDRGDTVEKL